MSPRVYSGGAWLHQRDYGESHHQIQPFGLLSVARFLLGAGSVSRWTTSSQWLVAGWPSGAGASGDRVLNRGTSRRWKGALPRGLGSVIGVGRSNPGEARHPGHQALSRPQVLAACRGVAPGGDLGGLQGVHRAPRRGSAPRRLPHTRFRLRVGWNRLAARSARGHGGARPTASRGLDGELRIGHRQDHPAPGEHPRRSAAASARRHWRPASSWPWHACGDHQ